MAIFLANAIDFYDHIRTKNISGKFFVSKYLSIFDEFVGELAPKSIVDVACGKGALTDRGFRLTGAPTIVGLDLDPSNVVFAKQYNSKPDFLNATGYHLPFKDNSFDLVVCTEALEHLRDPENFLKELERISDYAVISVPNEPLWSIKNILRGKYLSNLGCTPGHINCWNKKGFENLLKSAYSDIDIKSAYIWNLALCG